MAKLWQFRPDRQTTWIGKSGGSDQVSTAVLKCTHTGCWLYILIHRFSRDVVNRCSESPILVKFATKTPSRTLIGTPMWCCSNDRVSSRGPHAPLHDYLRLFSALTKRSWNGSVTPQIHTSETLEEPSIILLYAFSLLRTLTTDSAPELSTCCLF